MNLTTQDRRELKNLSAGLKRKLARVLLPGRRAGEDGTFSYDELSPKAQERALSELWDINVDYEWWDYIYDDAKRVGILIQGFDIDRRQIDLKFKLNDENVAKLIMKEHGSGTRTYQLAEALLQDRERAKQEAIDSVDVSLYPGGEQDPDYKDAVTDALQLADETYLDLEDLEFQEAVGKEYLRMLRDDYNELTSEEAILESIEANDYRFTLTGELV